MASVLNLLKDVQEIEAIPVGFPNGAETIAIKKGMVRLSSKIILNNVLLFSV